MLQAGHRRNNSGDVGLWRRPASDEEEVVRGMRSRRSRSELVMTRGDVFDRRPRKDKRRQRRLRTCAALVVATLVGACAVAAVAHRGRHRRPRWGTMRDRRLRGLCSRFVVGVV